MPSRKQHYMNKCPFSLYVYSKLQDGSSARGLCLDNGQFSAGLSKTKPFSILGTVYTSQESDI